MERMTANAGYFVYALALVPATHVTVALWAFRVGGPSTRRPRGDIGTRLLVLQQGRFIPSPAAAHRARLAAYSGLDDDNLAGW